VSPMCPARPVPHVPGCTDPRRAAPPRGVHRVHASEPASPTPRRRRRNDPGVPRRGVLHAARRGARGRTGARAAHRAPDCIEVWRRRSSKRPTQSVDWACPTPSSRSAVSRATRTSGRLPTSCCVRSRTRASRQSARAVARVTERRHGWRCRRSLTPGAPTTRWPFHVSVRGLWTVARRAGVRSSPRVLDASSSDRHRTGRADRRHFWLRYRPNGGR